MSAENYNKVIESLSIKFVQCNNYDVASPLHLIDFEESENTVIFLRKGKLQIADTEIKEGQALLIPANCPSDLIFGIGESIQDMDMEEFRFKRNGYFKESGENNGPSSCEITLVSFDAKIFDTVNFFNTLEITPFSLDHPILNGLIYDITKEQYESREGYQRIISLKTEHIVIEIIRYILDNNLFVEKMATNSTYFKDPRLISLFQYIKDNIKGELTNKKLADIAGVSEDYVGQYFKALTGINPQDYIEYKRMENAVELLRTTKMSIRDVGKSCGYKDTAYFCRRFKMMYGIPAGKMRKRETLINL